MPLAKGLILWEILHGFCFYPNHPIPRSSRLVEVGRLVQENRGGRSDFQGQRGVSWAERGQGHRQIGPSLGNLSYGNAERMVQMEHFRGMAKNRNLQGQGWEQEDPHEKRLANG